MASYRVHYHRLELARRNILEKEIIRGKREGNSLEVIVEFESGKKDRAYSRLSSLGRVNHVFDFIPYMSLLADAADLEGLLKGCSRGFSELRGFVRKVEFSSCFSIPKPSKRRLDRDVWNLENIGVYDARQYCDGEGVKIAVIDTGVDYTHPEVRGRFGRVKGFDFVKNCDNPMDMNGHGTHVAGICAGNNYGIATGSDLYAIRVLDENGSGSESNVIAGIEWALKNGADVANLSLGSPVASSAFEDICYYSWKHGLIIVAAAGNNGGEYAMYPAAFGEPVVAVAAVDRYNNHAGFSNVCITNDVSAPGVSITSAYLNGSYATLDGTSMACPHVSGSLALAVPLLRGRDPFKVLESSCEDIGSDREVFGAGLIRADRMVLDLQPRGFAERLKSLVW
ncbi:S8 family peptidase [Candidatus Woesearchaeota archaeon]|nr:S8 family peptidase [Candidatus Woesearchaeota archaeon]